MVINEALPNFEQQIETLYGYYDYGRVHQLWCMRTGMS